MSDIVKIPRQLGRNSEKPRPVDQQTWTRNCSKIFGTCSDCVKYDACTKNSNKAVGRKCGEFDDGTGEDERD